MISVIIPAYNSENYIRNCLNSVLTQKNADFEVVVINDGSTDKTGDICLAYNLDARFVYREQDNRGQGSARNLGIRIAKGDWLVFLDSDDELCEGALEVISNAISEDESLELICYCYEQNLLDGTLDVSNYSVIPEDNERLIKNVSTFLWDKAIKKQLWQRLEIELDNFFGEDIKAAYLCSAMADGFKIINKPLIKHYLRGCNLSCNSEKVRQIPISLKNVLGTFREKGLFPRFTAGIIRLLASQIINIRESDAFILADEVRKEIEDEILDLFKEIYGYEIVIIGSNDFLWMEDILDSIFFNERIVKSVYETIDKFIIADEDKGCDQQIYLLDFETEARLYRTGTRSEAWLDARLKRKLDELKATIIKRGKAQKIIVLGSDRVKPDFCLLQNLCELEILLGEREDCSIYPKEENKKAFDADSYFDSSFWNRGEQYRYMTNENTLAAWLKIKQTGRSLEEYFIKKGYKKIGIYGIGYIGEMLDKELSEGMVEVTCLMERFARRLGDREIVQIGDKTVSFDVMVVTTANIFYAIKYNIRNCYGEDTEVVSIEDVVYELI
ncbi:glycosyltransferase family 2 protein [Butyrivibrio sp. AE3004]|uniref:glycosyltransferase family 2 protein n=1 Tax=Butyrivibrio sp. AE3004 TaxID=1506994 RepID=UPI000691FDA5|nr:glycosyltransferase family 2 protein [Butyrivibrio sp. AE3004]